MLAWHFTNNMRLRDGTPLVEGKTYSLPQDQQTEICVRGYHASRCVLDARHYVRGTELSLVWCAGDVVEQDDKLVCRHRTVLHVFNWVEVVAQPWFAEATAARDAARAKADAAWDAAWAKADTAWAKAYEARDAAWAKADAALDATIQANLMRMV